MPRVPTPFRFFVALMVCLSWGQTHAGPLVPGATIPAPSEPDPTGGVVQAGTGIAQPFVSPAGPGQFSGTLTTTVIKNDPSNLLGGITFTYRLTNDPQSLAAMERMTNLNFTGFLTDVSWQSPAGGVIPTSVDRDTGSTIGWSFSQLGAGIINPGQASALLVIQTNALTFTAINANIIDGQIAIVSSFGPGVPEPAALFVVGAGLLVLSRRRI